MPVKRIANMTLAESKIEFKALADKLQPINARRKKLADHIASLEDVKDAELRVSALSPKQRRGMLTVLKKEFEK